MNSTSTTSMIRGAAIRFMLLLLPCWGHGGHIATLEIQERQYRRRLLSIEHIHLFHRGNDLAHRLQVEAAPRHLRCLTIFRQERVKTRHITLGRVSTVDGIALGLGNGAFDLPTLTRYFLVVHLSRLVLLAFPLLLSLIHLVEGAFDLVRGGATLCSFTVSTRKPVSYRLSSSCIFT